MRFTCLDNRSGSLSDHQRPRGEMDWTTYPITAGRPYLVVGMFLWENVLTFLVRDDWENPCYAPSGLFDVGTASIPERWRFSLSAGIHAPGRDLWSNPLGAAWGYPEFVDDPNHGSALAEGEPSALAIFEQRYAEALELDRKSANDPDLHS